MKNPINCLIEHFLAAKTHAECPQRETVYTGTRILKKYGFSKKREGLVSRVSFFPSELDGKYSLTAAESAEFLQLLEKERFIVSDRDWCADGTYYHFSQECAGMITKEPGGLISISGPAGNMLLRYADDSSRDTFRFLDQLINVKHSGACLVAMEGPYSGELFALKRGEASIGRVGCDIMLNKDYKISRHHARIVYDTETKTFYLVEGKPVNRTYLNGTPLLDETTTELKDNDQLRMGMSLFRVVIYEK